MNRVKEHERKLARIFLYVLIYSRLELSLIPYLSFLAGLTIASVHLARYVSVTVV